MAKKKAKAHKASKAVHKVHHAKEDQISHFFRTHKTAKWLLPFLVVLMVIYFLGGSY